MDFQFWLIMVPLSLPPTPPNKTEKENTTAITKREVVQVGIPVHTAFLLPDLCLRCDNILIREGPSSIISVSTIEILLS